MNQNENEKRKQQFWRDAFFAIIMFVVACIFAIFNHILIKGQQLKFLEKHNRIDDSWELKSKRYEFFDHLSKLIDKRYYMTMRFSGAIKENNAEKIGEIEAKFTNAIEDWMFNIYKNLALIEYYFGMELRNEFEEKINNPIVKIADKIENVRKNNNYRKKLKTKKIDEEINKLRGNILRFYKKILNFIDNTK